MAAPWWYVAYSCLVTVFITTTAAAGSGSGSGSSSGSSLGSSGSSPTATKVTCPLPCTCQRERVVCGVGGGGRQQMGGGGQPPPSTPPSSSAWQPLGITMTSIPHPLPNHATLTSLTITHTSVRRVTDSDFADLLRLQFLNLSSNSIEKVDDGAFRDLGDLQSLLMGDNFLQELSSGMFQGLTVLKVLDVSGNRLVELTARRFMPLKNLELLDLSSNEIEHIGDQAFLGLYRLRTLIMTGNKLMAINENQFRLLYSLGSLVLDDCRVQLVEIHAFSSLTLLTRLSLALNRKLGFLQAETFVSDEEVKLGYLSLRGTGVQEVPVAALETLTGLRSLDLSQTPIPVLRNASFARLHSLVNLTLEALPRLHRLEEDAFFGLDSLERLTVSHNRLLKDIGEGTFANLSRLRFLDLSYNGLETFRAGLAADWAQLDVLDLRGNPLHCDCGSAWMLTVLSPLPRMDTTIPASTRKTGTAKHEWRVGDMCDDDDKFSASFASSASASTNTEATSTTLMTETSETSPLLTRRVACRSPSRFAGRCLLSLSAEDLCSTPGGSERGGRLQRAVLAVGACCLALLTCGLLFRFRGRLCRRCSARGSGGYAYHVHRNRGDSRQSSLVDVLDMDSTQQEFPNNSVRV